MDNSNEKKTTTSIPQNHQGFNPLWALVGMGILIVAVLVAEFFGLKSK